MAAYSTREEFMSAVQAIIGENTTDDAIAFVENMADTYDALSDAEWARKYDELDRSWRERFIKRFNEPTKTTKTETKTDENDETDEDIQIDDLFTEVKKKEDNK